MNIRALRRHGLALLLATLGAMGASLVWAHVSPPAAEACWSCYWEEAHEEETIINEPAEEQHREETNRTERTLQLQFVGAGAARVHGYEFCESPWADGSCEVRVWAGETVSVTPVPPAGTTFTGWGGACSGTGVCEPTMGEDRIVTLNFFDQAPPLVPTIVTPTKGEVVQQPPGSGVVVKFTNSGDSYTRQFLCRLNTSDYRVCTSPWTTRRLKPGPNTVRVRARDAAGNTSTPTTRRFTIVG